MVSPVWLLDFKIWCWCGFFFLKTRIFTKVSSIPFVFICRRVKCGSKGPRSALILAKGRQLFLSKCEITVWEIEEERTLWAHRRSRNNFPATTSLSLQFIVFILHHCDSQTNHEVTSARCLIKRTGDTWPGLQGKVVGIYLKMPWNDTADTYILDLANQTSDCSENRFGW